ncbi:MAG: hypothetical protein PVG32_03435 [Anaerolineales bacterium]|jgi:hypothetical protein
MAIRDAVNRSTRKPFSWGGLAGYQQLEAIDQALTKLTTLYPERAYFQQLSKKVKRVLDKNRTLADNVKEAHQWLRQISDCLRYPQGSFSDEPSNSLQVAREMEGLLDRFDPDPKYQRPQSALKSKLQWVWNLYGPDLLHTYDVPGLPPDNLQIESLFGRLRRHQRRVSGRKSTRPLREFGHYQVLFCADSQADLLKHLRTVPLHEYRKHRRRLESAETTRRFMHRLHRDAEGTLQRLVTTYVDLANLYNTPKCSI